MVAEGPIPLIVRGMCLPTNNTFMPPAGINQKKRIEGRIKNQPPFSSTFKLAAVKTAKGKRASTGLWFGCEETLKNTLG